MPYNLVNHLFKLSHFNALVERHELRNILHFGTFKQTAYVTMLVFNVDQNAD